LTFFGLEIWLYFQCDIKKARSKYESRGGGRGGRGGFYRGMCIKSINS